MSEGTACFNYYGVPLPTLGEGCLALGAILSVKYIDANGKIRFQEWKTPDLHSIEALGMIETFKDTVKSNIMNASQ